VRGRAQQCVRALAGAGGDAQGGGTGRAVPRRGVYRACVCACLAWSLGSARGAGPMKNTPRRFLRSAFAVVVGFVVGSVVNMGLIHLGGIVIPPPSGADTATVDGLR